MLLMESGFMTLDSNEAVVLSCHRACREIATYGGEATMGADRELAAYGSLASLVSRRRFLVSGVTGFALIACTSPGPAEETARQPGAAVPLLLQSPAYAKRTFSGGVFLETHTRTGERIVFQVDPRGELARDLAPTAEQYQAGRTCSFERCLGILRQRFPDDDPEQQRIDYERFLEAAIKAGILYPKGNKVVTKS